MRVVVCAAVFAILSLQPEIADAHANLERADPSPAAQLAQAPRQLRLTFGEPLENRFTRVRVLDTSRQSIDRGDSRVAPDDPRTLLVSVNENTPDGLYTVAWRTVSAIDGHSASGAYPLLVGSPPQPTQAVLSEPTNEARFAPETAIARWWLYLTAGAAFGLLVTWRLVLSPILKHLPAARAAAVRRTTRTVRVSLSLLLLGTLYAAIAQAASATDLPVWDTLGTPLQSVLGQGRFAVVWWPRLAFVLLALGIVAWRGTERLSGDLVLAFLACVLLTSSITSHAAALASGAYLAVVVDWVHLLGVAIWIGGLLSLVLWDSPPCWFSQCRACFRHGSRLAAGRR